MVDLNSLGADNTRVRLPHLQFPGSVYFVTWRLASGVPALTAEERSVVASALKHFHTSRYRLCAYVVMNDHVHVVFQPLESWDLSKILHSWRSFSSHWIQRSRKTAGTLWEPGYYDRIVRTEEDLREKVNYILDNPRRRWAELKEYEWAGLVQWLG